MLLWCPLPAAVSSEWVIWVFPSAHSSSSLFPPSLSKSCWFCLHNSFSSLYILLSFHQSCHWFYILVTAASFPWLCNLAYFVSRQSIAAKGFCSLVFDRESTCIWLLHLCQFRHKLHVLNMNICSVNSFSSSETLFKMLLLFMPAKTWLWWIC